ncbi:glycosyltransferase family 2 protein [Neisseria chenwenguii]|uniref:Glycosyltransferase n=1 Tax=Neisseria chenwenguii TaxID=1853278 RepID=A0A220S2L3_9NEIS|nr:glycosyltransferase family 2 protein [Neisseria chenwenguii]ASK27608.1 glycosyltransferase [Neisseria chenwenguii]ROV55505.1 glycosyltransferase [Neisseria chenwenguii]
MNISLVVPVFNEEDTIPLFYQAVRAFPKLQDYRVEIVFINDGSSDKTAELLDMLAAADPLVRPLHFTRNFGKEAALFAGLEHAGGDAVIPMDVDLQDPIEVIPLMVEKWQEGADMVLAKRTDRADDSCFKRWSASAFYKIHNKMSRLKIEENVGDFRLISREALQNIVSLPEHNLFMKGVLSWVGGNTAVVGYSRPQRVVGKSKFNGWKLWNLALEGITGFSTVPLRIWTYIGMLLAGSAFCYGAWIVIRTLLFGSDVKGYPSLLVSVLFLGGIQLIGIGILGEYIGRIYQETKKRPRYLLKNKTVKKNEWI